MTKTSNLEENRQNLQPFSIKSFAKQETKKSTRKKYRKVTTSKGKTYVWQNICVTKQQTQNEHKTEYFWNDRYKENGNNGFLKSWELGGGSRVVERLFIV